MFWIRVGRELTRAQLNQRAKEKRKERKDIPAAPSSGRTLLQTKNRREKEWYRGNKRER